ncbi:MAG: cytidine deaminase [Flavobacteriaceae bacterium]|nr:cytidine deaminase [Flavobacteriaceae bacterium]
MKKISITSEFLVYESLAELSKADQQLMNHAIEARKKAYAPYSQFSVGAAILLDNDKIILGNNQENAAYPSGLCAERVAIYNAGANHPDSIIVKIAISANSAKKSVSQPVAPCGACRQTIAEYEIKQEKLIPILFMGESGKVVETESLKNLLPLGFDKSLL